MLKLELQGQFVKQDQNRTCQVSDFKINKKMAAIEICSQDFNKI